MKHILKKVTQQTNNKYLNIFLAEYQIDDGIKNYQICSRKSFEKLKVHTDKIIPDGVRILPYFYENDKMKVCFIKEFRYAINDYIYAFPAGLIDEGEDPIVSAKRELEEEIGASIKKIYKTDKASFLSAGLGDESLENYEALVVLDKKPHLDFSEDISLHIVDFDDMLSFLENNNVGMQTLLQAKSFYYKQMYLKLLNEKIKE